MSDVNIPQAPYSPSATVVPAVGAAIGGFFGGSGGAMAGQKLGQALTSQPKAPGEVQGSDALTRRMQNQASSPESTLAEASAALRSLPPEYQQMYGPTLNQATQVASQGGP